MASQTSDRTKASPGTDMSASPLESMMSAVPNAQMIMLTGPHLQAAMLKAAFTQQRELLGFFNQRCDEELKLAERLSSATSLGDLYSAMACFYQDATSQYINEAGKIAQVGTNGTIEAVQSMQQEAEAITATTPIKRNAA